MYAFRNLFYPRQAVLSVHRAVRDECKTATDAILSPMASTIFASMVPLLYYMSRLYHWLKCRTVLSIALQKALYHIMIRSYGFDKAVGAWDRLIDKWDLRP